MNIRERLTANANDFDSIITELLKINDDLLVALESAHKWHLGDSWRKSNDPSEVESWKAHCYAEDLIWQQKPN